MLTYITATYPALGSVGLLYVVVGATRKAFKPIFRQVGGFHYLPLCVA